MYQRVYQCLAHISSFDVGEGGLSVDPSAPQNVYSKLLALADILEVHAEDMSRYCPYFCRTGLKEYAAKGTKLGTSSYWHKEINAERCCYLRKNSKAMRKRTRKRKDPFCWGSWSFRWLSRWLSRQEALLKGSQNGSLSLNCMEPQCEGSHTRLPLAQWDRLYGICCFCQLSILLFTRYLN